MSRYFIDFEGFSYRGRHKLKELCIINVDNPLDPVHYIFDATGAWTRLDQPQQDLYNYQTNEVHQLYWNEGNIRYCRKCIMHRIKKAFPFYYNGTFYAMDEEKTFTLKRKFPKLNIVNYNQSFNTLPCITNNITCPYRMHGTHCSYLTCLRLFCHYVNVM